MKGSRIRHESPERSPVPLVVAILGLLAAIASFYVRNEGVSATLLGSGLISAGGLPTVCKVPSSAVRGDFDGTVRVEEGSGFEYGAGDGSTLLRSAPRRASDRALLIMNLGKASGDMRLGRAGISATWKRSPDERAFAAPSSTKRH